MGNMRWFPDIFKSEKFNSKNEDENDDDYNYGKKSYTELLLDLINTPNEDGSKFKFVSKYDKLDDSDRFPISQRKAFKIAEADQNLKTDFYKKDKRHITYLSFDDFYVDLVERNGEKYWLVQITEGDISWIDGDTCCDGWLGKDDCSKLQCLVNANTGEYKYFSILS